MHADHKWRTGARFIIIFSLVDLPPATLVGEDVFVDLVRLGVEFSNSVDLRFFDVFA
jgi:hypothetical protein